MAESGAAGVNVTYNATDANGTITDIAGTALATNTIGVTVAAWDTTAPTLVSYTITNTTITPPQTTSIDVKFSEHVSAIIKIEDASGNLVNKLYSSSGVTDPSEKIWNGTYTNGTTVPDGIYTVNVSGVSTTTKLSVVNTSGKITVTSETPTLDSIVISPESCDLIVGGSRTFTAVCYNSTTVIGFPTLTWNSSNTTVGTINATTGVFTAVAAGTTTVNATNGSVTGNATVNVTAAPVLTTITVEPATLDIGVGGTHTFTATTLDQSDNAIGAVVAWDSSNTTVGTINAITGVFTAVAAGTTTVNATNGSVTGNATITVGAAANQPPTAVIASPTPSGTYHEGNEVSFDATGSIDPDGTIVLYNWTFGDGNISTGVSTTHTYTTNGSMTVTLTVTDNDSVTNTTTVTINVLAAGAVGVTLYEGWNLIAVPVNDTSANTAAELASKITGCKEVVKWDASTQTYVPRTKIDDDWTGTDFAITGGTGLFVNVEGATTVGFTGGAWS